MNLPLPHARPRHRRRAVLALAAAAIAAAAAAAVVASLPPSRQAPGMSPPPQSRVPAGTAGATPGEPAVSTSGWRAAGLDGTLVPVSPTAGPREDSGHLASGFADTPAGAVLAAVGIAVRTSGQLGPAIFTPTITRQVTGAAAGTLLAAAWADYAQASAQHPPASPGGPAGTTTATARAFQLTSWTPSAAAIEVVTAADGATGQEAVTRLQVRRLDGDWRLVAPPGGDFAAEASPVTTLSGFTTLPWR